MIETNRLKIYAASQEKMETFIEAQTLDDLKAAYTEMLNGCLEHTNPTDWNAPDSRSAYISESSASKGFLRMALQKSDTESPKNTRTTDMRPKPSKRYWNGRFCILRLSPWKRRLILIILLL